MADRKQFTEKLGEILKYAIGQNYRITLNEVELYFEEDQLSEEQIGLVCDYLMSQRVQVEGYQPKMGKVRVNGEEERNPVASLTEEEQRYVENYLQELAGMPNRTPEDARMFYYLPKVVQEAIDIHDSDVYIGDLIQEGNMALMMAFAEAGEETPAEEKVMSKVRTAIRTEQSAHVEMSRRDRRMVSRVSELDDTIRQMSKDAGGKVSVDEVAESLGMTDRDIADIMQLAGEKIEDLEDESEAVDIHDMMSVLDKDDVIDLQEKDESADPKAATTSAETDGISWDDDATDDDEIVWN